MTSLFAPPLLLASAINLQGLMLAIPLVAAVLLIGWWFSKRKFRRKKRPGQHLVYTVPDKTATACREALGAPGEDDLLAYDLQPAQSGGWYIHFTGHRPTGQMLDTLFLLQFEGDSPARFSLTFTREAFGMKEPVIGEGLLDEFFAQKLGARRVEEAASAQAD